MRVRGSGPTPCAFALIGESPGFEEGRTGVPFVGKTGKELNRYLDGHHVPAREDWFVTNLYREYHGKDYEYGAADLATDELELLAELRRVRPRIIVAMGRHATRWLLGDVDMEDCHALPWLVDSARWSADDPDWPEDHTFGLGRHECVVFPLYHIAAGFHAPAIQGYVLYGFQQLGRFFEGALAPRRLYEDAYEGHERYVELAHPDELRIDPSLPLAIDSEGYPHAPWSLQYSQAPGEGYLIRAPRPGHDDTLRHDLLDAFAACLARQQAPLVFHNALHDLTVLRAMGVETAHLRFDDTMVKAYLLQVEPQGLKPLCIRHCNMRMRSYDDVLGDTAHWLAEDYALSLIDCEQADYDVRQQEEFERINRTPLRGADGRPKRDKSGNIRYRHTRVLPSIPKTPLHKAAERILRSRTPRKLWLDQSPEIINEGERLLGPMPVPSLDYVDPAIAIPYGCRDADGTTRLNPELDARLDAMGLREVYNLEIRTYPFIERMATTGIRPDLAHFADLSARLAWEIVDRQVELEEATGREGFNANSGDQVADYLFDTLGLEGMKRTSSGRYSTNDKILEALERANPQYPVLSTIRAYRELYKLKYTFVDRIPAFVERWPMDGRIHATFRTTRVVTGRLAASDPNLLAQPIHGAFAKDFQRGWVADEGHVLGSWDLSQIELRVLAHLSQDPYMLSVYRGEIRGADGKPLDLHAALAERIFGVPAHLQDKSKHRLPAKSINFGVMMGMTEKGLVVELRKNGLEVDEDDARRWLTQTLDTYQGVRVYMEARKAEARRQGYVRCLSGRIRYIGGIKSPHADIREEAERFSFSTPIQEGAQLIMKTAESAIWDMLVTYWRQGEWIEPILQIHDDIKLEMAEHLAPSVHGQMVAIMTRSYQGLSVPIETSGEWGYNLRDMQAF